MTYEEYLDTRKFLRKKALKGLKAVSGLKKAAYAQEQWEMKI